ncbi:MAG: sulfite exporter TauE/SafE family protein [Deltaproteobacteria bacterium]|nr:sulfite exporter TauE/SafE family protein [Deltaproteobacteria bacterium]
MNFFREWGKFMMMGARAHARWEIDVSNTILGDKKRLIILGLLTVPVIWGGIAFAEQMGTALPELLGGKKAYSPAFYSTGIFIVSILIGLAAGLITGCIGAGGGFIIAPALMSAGIKGILAVGTDLFHIFAKAIMGSVIHRKLGNVSVPLAVVFLIGAIIGATFGGLINRVLYEINPVLSDAFITTIYSLMLGFLGIYAMTDFLKARRSDKGDAPHGGGDAHGGKIEGAEMGNLAKKLQGMKIPPMIRFDAEVIPGGRSISWLFLVLSGALVGLAAGIMGVGGGFLTFPIFVYMLGVSSMTTVGTDIFQIVFTAGYAAISQYAIYGFIFYTLAMGMLLGSLIGIQIGAMVTKVVPGITIRGFYAMAVLAGFVIGGFSVWVIGTFLANIGVLKGEEGRS